MTMTNKPNDMLLLAGKVLALIMQGVLALTGAVMAICIPLILLFQGSINDELVSKYGDALDAFPAMRIALLFAVIVVGFVLAFVFFGKLRRIINTVGEGDPFVPENAERLNLMGWLGLGIYALTALLSVIALSISDWAKEIEGIEINIDVGIDLQALLLIIILFILARVFKHGTTMREDLEGTV